MTQEALKLALKALENGDVPTPENVGKNLDAITAIKEALAQRTEPVISTWVLREVYFDEDGEPTMHRSPPQRTWVGLTDDEIAQGCKESWVTEQAWQSAVWWAEDKLKDKNT
jgi:hypothetical protein